MKTFSRPKQRKRDCNFSYQSIYSSNIVHLSLPNPDKPERIATKAPRHKKEMFIIIELRVLVSWWRKYFVR
jgi:hypothetical protein